ncbi:hypothetical protein TRFO_23152 [Tritrichomonas foetus]|uniref:Uncharacterized protein n=1 Tax=Tritrichomonas foetus TaxID=1144522 RepID=A0A1J4KAZ1_9EUKA|nr:hypothetical protein TRFO_23152 [Tritrichomonas foetus]|eukprot:OHT08387.1 hypothetical protein TRFO_23152 [Tritrichomonas foetus]
MVLDAAVPVLVIANDAGRIDIFDVRSRRTIYKFYLKNGDYATSIKWSKFSSSSFFVGSRFGKLYKYEIEVGQIVKFELLWELSFNFQIDHICIEPQFAEMCTIASEMGSLAIIRCINTNNPIASPDVVTLTNKTDRISEIKYYPTSNDFVILVTQSNCLLYSITECHTTTLLNIPNTQRFHILHDSGNITIIVRSDTVELWKFSVNQNRRLSEIPLATSKILGQSEILACDMMGDNVILLTAGYWLTTVEVHNFKLFVTHRIKLLDSKPISYSFNNDSIIFASKDGKVLVTETSNSNFVMQMRFKGQEKKSSISSQSSTEIQEHQQTNQQDQQNQDNQQYARLNLKEYSDTRKKRSFSVSSPFNTTTVPNISPLAQTPSSAEYQSSSTATGENVPSFSTFSPLVQNEGNDDSMPSLLSPYNAGNFNTYNGMNQKPGMSVDAMKRKHIRTRRSILKSCASSTSLSLSPIVPNLPPVTDILDQSIIEKRDDSPLNSGRSNRSSPAGNRAGRRVRNSDLGMISEYSSTDNRLTIEMVQASLNEHIRKRRVSSTTTNDLKDTLLAQIAKENAKPKAQDDNKAKETVYSTSEKAISSSQAVKELPKHNYGNNCSIMWSYQVSDRPLEHIEWISTTRALAWSIGKGKENTIYLIDFKLHRVTRLFDKKAGMIITSVTISENKMFFIVVFNGFVAFLFQNRIVPKQVNSFTFKSTVYGSFIQGCLLFVNSHGVLTVTDKFEKGKSLSELKIIANKALKLRKDHGSITCVLGHKSNLYLGTSTGFLLKVENRTYQVTDVLQMKSSIVEFRLGPRRSFLVSDNKNTVVTITEEGDHTFVPFPVKSAVLSSPTTLLVRRKNANCIEVHQSIGQYTPAYPTVAARCPMMMPPYKWAQSLFSEDIIDTSVCINYGMSYVASLINARRSPNFTFEQITFLRDLIMDSPHLWRQAFRLSIFLRDFDAAHNIIVNVPPTDKDWKISMFKTSLFCDQNESQVQAILFSATNLIHNGFIEDGIDMLLTAGLWVDAVNLLLQLNRLGDAAKIARVYRDEETLNTVSDVADRMLGSSTMFAYALMMMCESGLDDQVIRELENLGQTTQAKVLQLVK